MDAFTKLQTRAHYELLAEQARAEEITICLVCDEAHAEGCPRCPDCGEAPCHPECLSGGGLC